MDLQIKKLKYELFNEYILYPLGSSKLVFLNNEYYNFVNDLEGYVLNNFFDIFKNDPLKLKNKKYFKYLKKGYKEFDYKPFLKNEKIFGIYHDLKKIFNLPDDLFKVYFRLITIQYESLPLERFFELYTQKEKVIYIIWDCEFYQEFLKKDCKEIYHFIEKYQKYNEIVYKSPKSFNDFYSYNKDFLINFKMKRGLF